MTQEEERRKLVSDIVRTEDEAALAVTGDIRQLISETLAVKDYTQRDVVQDKEFPITAGGQAETVRADFIVSIDGAPYMAIICSLELVSRERHAVALSRVVYPTQIPISVVSDGLSAHVLETMTGRVIAEGLEGIPSRDEAVRFMASHKPVHYPPDRLEKQKRILMAFECIACRSL